MYLGSCERCGVVFDLSKVTFPVDLENDDGSMNGGKGIWSNEQEQFVPFVPCPICGCPILQPNYKGGSV